MDWVRQHIVEVVEGVFVAAFSAFAVAWLKGFCQNILPSPRDSYIWVVETARDIRRFRPSPDKFLILVAQLDGDDVKGTHTRAVARAFQGQVGVERLQTLRTLRLFGIGGAAESEAVATGRRWLAKRNADLLIWGEVLQKEKCLNLWFTSKDATSDFQQSRFPLEANLLTGDFTEVATGQLVSLSLSAIKPATEARGTFLRDILRPVADRLRNLLNDSTLLFTLRQRSDLSFALGIALCAITHEEGGAANLQEAVNLLSSSIENIDRAVEPLAWANVQHYRGVALTELGRETLEPEILNNAVAAFRSALDDRPRERVPLDWAKTQHSLGGALMLLRGLRVESSYFTEAIAAFDAALTERRPDRVPVEWASTTNSRALAVLALAGEDVGTTKINEAIFSLQTALEATSPSVTPSLWGGIKLNLGLALLSLAERQTGGDALDEALTTGRSILPVWSREEMPKLWVQAQLLIGRALTALGERETDPEYLNLKEAEEVLRAALEVCTGELSAVLRAMVQAALGNTLSRLADTELVQIPLDRQLLRTDPQRIDDPQQPVHWVTQEQEFMRGIQRIQERNSGLNHLEDAVNAFQSSLDEFPRENFPAAWALIQHDCAIALTRLGEQQEESDYLLEAVGRVNSALEVWTYEYFPWNWARAQTTLSCIFIRLGERQEEGRISYLESAVVACQKAEQVHTLDSAPLLWAKNQNVLASALYYLGQVQHDLAILKKSLRAYSSALEVLCPLSPKEIRGIENNIRVVQVKIEELGSAAIDRQA
jgi:tetratricopeptide (TPR) repeat protein